MFLQWYISAENLEWRDFNEPELGCGCEGLVLCDGEHQEESLPAAEVVVSDGGVVLLTRCVQDVDLHVLAVQDDLFPVAVRLGGLVVLHKLEPENGLRNSKQK